MLKPCEVCITQTKCITQYIPPSYYQVYTLQIKWSSVTGPAVTTVDRRYTHSGLDRRTVERLPQDGPNAPGGRASASSPSSASGVSTSSGSSGSERPPGSRASTARRWSGRVTGRAPDDGGRVGRAVTVRRAGAHRYELVHRPWG